MFINTIYKNTIIYEAIGSQNKNTINDGSLNCSSALTRDILKFLVVGKQSRWSEDGNKHTRVLRRLENTPKIVL